MKRYIINAILKESSTPYIPHNYLIQMPLWRNNIAPTLTRCGFIHLGDCIVYGDEVNLIEFKLSFVYDDNLVTVTIKEFIDKPSYN
jgi:hypothetical protein